MNRPVNGPVPGAPDQAAVVHGPVRVELVPPVDPGAAGPAAGGGPVAPSGVRLVTIDRPDALNALDEATLSALVDVFEGFARTPSVRAVVLTGAGDKAFVAGADVAAMVTMTSGAATAFSRLGHRLAHLMEELPAPIIAAVNGYALGGGCELALACDFIYASKAARFGQPEVKLGVIPGFGGTQRLVRRLGIARAGELLYTGEMVDATEAWRIGLVNRVFEPEQLMAGACATAAAIAARAPLAVAAAKRAVRRGADLPLAEGCLLESELFGALFATEDLHAGMQAFIRKDKRPPDWQAR